MEINWFFLTAWIVLKFWNHVSPSITNAFFRVPLNFYFKIQIPIQWKFLHKVYAFNNKTFVNFSGRIQVFVDRERRSFPHHFITTTTQFQTNFNTIKLFKYLKKKIFIRSFIPVRKVIRFTFSSNHLNSSANAVTITTIIWFLSLLLYSKREKMVVMAVC